MSNSSFSLSRSARRPYIFKGMPPNSIGKDTDFALAITQRGTSLYIKFNGKWFRIGRLEEAIAAGDGKELVTEDRNFNRVNCDSVRIGNPMVKGGSKATLTVEDGIFSAVPSGSTSKSKMFANAANGRVPTFTANDNQITGETYLTYNTTDGLIARGGYVLENNANGTITQQSTAHNVAGKDLSIHGGAPAADTTNNIAGGDLSLVGGQSKGTAAGGSIILRVSTPNVSSASSLNVASIAMTISGAIAGQTLIDMGESPVGFTQETPTYNVDDTEVNFHTKGNKQFLTFGSGNITDLNLNFPNVSCNCILLVKQDGTGSRLITNYKTFDQAGGNASTVLFAGGSNPTLTTTADKTDIFSFYWDNTNHIAYGTVTQNF